MAKWILRSDSYSKNDVSTGLDLAQYQFQAPNIDRSYN